jgi:hypothetical protein
VAQQARRQFSLVEARALLPQVKAVTAEAVRTVEQLNASMERLPEDDTQRAALSTAIERTIHEWSDAIIALGLEAKGLWLVDFDNGQGYYCWCYPEETVSHFHDYDTGFRGRMKIV